MVRSTPSILLSENFFVFTSLSIFEWINAKSSPFLFLGHEYSDSRTLYALEDLAKIEEQLGHWGNSATWLWEAAELARRNVSKPEALWEEKVTRGIETEATHFATGERENGAEHVGQANVEMVHVVDKLIRALRNDGREGDAQAAKRIYAAYIQVR